MSRNSKVRSPKIQSLQLLVACGILLFAALGYFKCNQTKTLRIEEPEINVEDTINSKDNPIVISSDPILYIYGWGSSTRSVIDDYVQVLNIKNISIANIDYDDSRVNANEIRYFNRADSDYALVLSNYLTETLEKNYSRKPVSLKALFNVDAPKGQFEVFINH